MAASNLEKNWVESRWSRDGSKKIDIKIKSSPTQIFSWWKRIASKYLPHGWWYHIKSWQYLKNHISPTCKAVVFNHSQKYFEADDLFMGLGSYGLFASHDLRSPPVRSKQGAVFCPEKKIILRKRFFPLSFSWITKQEKSHQLNYGNAFLFCCLNFSTFWRILGEKWREWEREERECECVRGHQIERESELARKTKNF